MHFWFLLFLTISGFTFTISLALATEFLSPYVMLSLSITLVCFIYMIFYYMSDDPHSSTKATWFWYFINIMWICLFLLIFWWW